MKVLFNIAKYTLAGYGLLVFVNNLQKVVKKSREDKSEESHISEPELKDFCVVGWNDDDTLAMYEEMKNRFRENGKLSYLDVNEILSSHAHHTSLEDSDQYGWDEENCNVKIKYDKEEGALAIFLPKAKVLE